MRAALCSPTQPKNTRPKSIAMTRRSASSGRTRANSTMAWPRLMGASDRRRRNMLGRSASDFWAECIGRTLQVTLQVVPDGYDCHRTVVLLVRLAGFRRHIEGEGGSLTQLTLD